MPPWFTARVRQHVDRLVADQRTQAAYLRMKQYWPMLARSLVAHGLPDELGYIAWAESDFNPEARSPKPYDSVGMWGLTSRTAREYGLRVEAGRDDRLDPALSTEAAARYLANLIAEFGSDSFMLALAGYNLGENKLRRTLFTLAQQPGGLRPEDRTFWHLYRVQALQQETLEYVPRILAIAVICHDPHHYGLE